MNLKKLKNIPPWDWPAGASTLVIDTLTNRTASNANRLLAADLAGEYSILSEEIAAALLTVVESKDESPELRSLAAIALGPGLEDSYMGDYEDPEASPTLSESSVKKIQHSLHNIYLDGKAPKSVRRAALEASVRSPQIWHAGAVQSAYASNDAEWQLTSVFCMCYVKGFENQILEALNSPDLTIRYHAVNAAGNWEIDAAWPYIAGLISSDKVDKPLRIAAIKAAVSIRPFQTDILDPLVDSDDEDISETTMEALAEVGYDTSWDSEDFDEDEENDEDYDEYADEEDDEDFDEYVDEEEGDDEGFEGYANEESDEDFDEYGNDEDDENDEDEDK